MNTNNTDNENLRREGKAAAFGGKLEK